MGNYWKRPYQIPLRLRLTLWYTFSLGLILLLFTLFLYLQVRSSLLGQVDAALNLAANQALIGVENVGEKLVFQTAVPNPNAIRKLSDDFVIFLLASDSTVWDTLSNEDQIPQFEMQAAGYDIQLSEGEPWRVYRQIVDIGGVTGWIQAAQELDPITATLANLRRQILWGLPLTLLLAGLGGYFLASRALRPIDQMTQTAQAITASDLDQRLHYQGPADEVGRLAQTFDMMLDRLQTAFNRERRFTGDAAHELRTPLTALKGRIGVTLSQPRTPAIYQETLTEMEGQVDRLIRLSNDLLFMARLDQGQFRPQLQPIETADFLGAVLDQIRPLATNKSIALTETIPPGLVMHGDLDLLIRLFLNLLDNAVKYTPENGRITITAKSSHTHILIAITDSGPGIPPEHLPHLFERFYRVEGDRARQMQNNRQGGAGLGLAIAYEIARAHNGRLTVQSQPGKGTTFATELPLLPTPNNS